MADYENDFEIAKKLIVFLEYFGSAVAFLFFIGMLIAMAGSGGSSVPDAIRAATPFALASIIGLLMVVLAQITRASIKTASMTTLMYELLGEAQTDEPKY